MEAGVGEGGSRGSYQADRLSRADEEFQTDWFKISLLREAETEVGEGPLGHFSFVVLSRNPLLNPRSWRFNPVLFFFFFK